ncbi:carbon-nitrogen hydrolase family protein [Paenarthrobacter sp. NPDC090520]|uniref:carbon-nitrogen hydrolase family protein n=1 Tax=Paenarthrobacter sp. NPDC090520 TaxID=3364382 RepID=UPI0038240158
MSIPDELRVAACQTSSGSNIQANLEEVEAVLDLAAEHGARLAVLPEGIDYMGTADRVREVSRDLRSDFFSQRIAEKAAEHRMWVVGGSLHERVAGSDLTANTSQLFDPTGRRVSTFSKMHMFDVELADGFSYRESDDVQAGSRISFSEVDGVGVGTAICYDLRFPELFRLYAMKGARIVALPAAFTFTTGADHWELLVRARAVENQIFMIAAGQIGAYEPNGRSYGRSMIVDPWGTVLATAPDKPGTIAVADIDFGIQDEVRRRVPSLANRRPDVYDLREL